MNKAPAYPIGIKMKNKLMDNNPGPG